MEYGGGAGQGTGAGTRRGGVGGGGGERAERSTGAGTGRDRALRVPPEDCSGVPLPSQCHNWAKSALPGKVPGRPKGRRKTGTYHE